MFVILGMVCLLAAESNATLSGRVFDGNLQSVEDALVVISSARPREGLATKCPSCYSDCARRTRTDAAGRFSFDGLSDRLTFRLAAGATGYHGTVSDYVDPAEYPKSRLVIKQLLTKSDNERVQGQVLDAAGEPVVGAEVRSGYVRRDRTKIGDSTATSLVLTDERGNFEVTVGELVSRVTYRVTAAGSAPVEIDWHRSTGESLKVQLQPGASIRGRLLFMGQPLQGASIGMVRSGRARIFFTVPKQVSTDADGFFQFDQLPPEHDYMIYTLANQHTPGVLPVSYIEAPEHGKLADLGDLATQSAHTLKVTVRTAGGEPLPPQIKVQFGRNLASHPARLIVVSEGSVATTLMPGLGKERYLISLMCRGYKIQRTIPELPKDLTGYYPLLIEGDTELTIVIEQR